MTNDWITPIMITSRINATNLRPKLAYMGVVDATVVFIKRWFNLGLGNLCNLRNTGESLKPRRLFMDPQLLKVYHELEAQRAELLNLVKQLNDEQRDRKVSGKWSINEILSHLATSERLSMAYIKKKSNAIEALDNTGLIEELKMVFLKISQRGPFRFKAPKIVADHTPKHSFKESEEKWDEVRKQLLDFVQNINPQHSKKKIFKHPVVGKLNIRQAMEFFKEHVTHHLPQIKRLLS
jgi:uncharacterized damage-inducible protein DinB